MSLGAQVPYIKGCRSVHIVGLMHLWTSNLGWKTVQIFTEKYQRISWPMQFKPRMFKVNCIMEVWRVVYDIWPVLISYTFKISYVNYVALNFLVLRFYDWLSLWCQCSGYPQFPKHPAKRFCDKDLGLVRLSGVRNWEDRAMFWEHSNLKYLFNLGLKIWVK